MENLIEAQIDFGNNLYKWGKGWVVSSDEMNDFHFWSEAYIHSIGMDFHPDNGISSSQGINTETIEKIYLHPMYFSLTVRKDNLEKYVNEIKKMEYFKDVKFKVFDIKTHEELLESVQRTISFL